MNEPYIVLTKGGTAETELKKSRFIANVAVANTREEAEAFIESIRKKYYDARHNCYAYVCGKDGSEVKFSDDGEPSQTAGLPMYSVISKSGIRNVVVVVTRYFGGTLLGAGPLSGMYTEATALGLKASETAVMKYGVTADVKADYSEAEKIRRLFENENVSILSTDYSDKVIFSFATDFEKYEATVEKIISLSAGKALVEKTGEQYFKAGE